MNTFLKKYNLIILFYVVIGGMTLFATKRINNLDNYEKVNNNNIVLLSDTK